MTTFRLSIIVEATGTVIFTVDFPSPIELVASDATGHIISIQNGCLLVIERV